MPATYAHYTFGQECLEVMAPDIKDIVLRNIDIYNFGVHGPDILFYFDALKKNEVNTLGNEMHYISGKEVFSKQKEAYLKYDEKEAMLTYILGFLSHFAFDSSAHGYVKRKEEVSNVSHNKIEAEYEAHLIRKEGRTPSTVDRAKSLKPSKEIASILSHFFPFDEKTMFMTIQGQVHTLNLLHSTIGLKKESIRKMIELFKIKGDFGSLFVDNKESEICKDSNIRLDTLKGIALERYKKLIINLLDYLNDKDELMDYFNHNFEAGPDYQDILILSYEEELMYKGVENE